jgi:glycosyltransferase involved in cell wall biosynthesis
MNIVLGVHQFFPNFYSGTERYVLNLAHQLLTLGHRVTVLTYDYLAEAHELSPGGRLYFQRYAYQGIPVISFRHADNPDFAFTLDDPVVADEMAMLFEHEGIDIYHCAHPLRIAGSIQGARAAGIPVVLMLTDFWLMCPRGILLRPDNTLCSGPDSLDKCRTHCFAGKSMGDLTTRQNAAKTLASMADVVLSPSRFLIGAFEYNEFFPKGRVRLSRHGFDYSLVGDRTKAHDRNESDGVITIGYIGTIQYHKGVHVLVNAFRKVTCDKLRLDVWGGCLHETAYQAQVQHLAEGDSRIRFHGSYAYEDIRHVLRHIDVVVVPSIWYENAPLTITSSHAMGIPVIASDIGGMAEMVSDGRTGYTYPAGDADALAAHLSRLAASPSLLDEFRKAIAPPPGVEEEGFRMERLYRDLLARHAPAVAS